MKKEKLTIGILCGGPSLERGISLNSARSVCDHLQSDEIEVLPVYFDQHKKPYLVSRAQLYSNTPSDFDFKLQQSAKPLGKTAFANYLKSIDLAFPVMHGSFGEDGQIQRMLEKNNCPYIGSDIEACKKAFDKFNANEFIAQKGFYTLPSAVLKIHLNDHEEIIKGFFTKHKLKRAIIKPATGGSSIGVESVSNPTDALKKVHELFSKRVDTRLVIEPFCMGTEFTVIILQNKFGLPVAVLPTEMELDYSDHQIFDYRKKYLASRQVKYHCPPRFESDIIEKIQIQAEHLFQLLGMRDFARFDGWLLPDGNLWFSDFNPISGMEQNSFLFQQTTQIGMSHRDLLRFVVKSACRRYKIDFPEVKNKKSKARKRKINVLFGGKTAERQVSVMSGTNVWLKLRQSEAYEPHPYLLDTQNNVWKLPYYLTLNHTVEEIEDCCRQAKLNEQRLHQLKKRVLTKLSLNKSEVTENIFLPKEESLADFISHSEFVFIGLHGGIGEDGTLQKMLEKSKVYFNGSGSKASRLCMDKYATGELIRGLKNEGVYTAEKKLTPLSEFKGYKDADFKSYWKELALTLGTPTIIAKPQGDGCSAGIARLYSYNDLKKYVQYAEKSADHIPTGSLKNQHGIIEMPPHQMEQILFEQFVITDKVRVIGNSLKWETKTNWIEITMGVVEEKGKLKAMSPSLTVAVGNILTLEEKFQGGTGVNITPPPQPYVKKSAIEKAKKRMELVASKLGITGYARIDAFMHVKTGELIIIEANSTPGLTPSTVIYHQALEEKTPLYPGKFLEKIVKNGFQKSF